MIGIRKQLLYFLLLLMLFAKVEQTYSAITYAKNSSEIGLLIEGEQSQNEEKNIDCFENVLQISVLSSDLRKILKSKKNRYYLNTYTFLYVIFIKLPPKLVS